MTMLHVIRPDGTYESKVYMGELEYGTPGFAEMRKIIGCETIEHVSVLWQGKPAHMFVDEDGRARGAARNDRATRVYYNNTWARERRPQLVYDDLAQDPGDQYDLHGESEGFDIVGVALLWEGGME